MVSAGFEPTHILVQPKLYLNAVTTLPPEPYCNLLQTLKYVHQSTSKFHYKKL
jgi:hypothetical protein